MLEALEILAKAGPNSTDARLKELGRKFVFFDAPADSLLRARREWESFKSPNSAMTSCSLVVARAEDLVRTMAGTKDYDTKFLALSREIDNLRKSLIA